MFIIFFVLSILSCKSDTTPLVYDKSLDIVEKEVQLLHLLISNDNFKEAEVIFDKDLKLYPDNKDLLIMRAFLLLQEKKFYDSEQLYMSLLQKNRVNPLCYLGLARIYRFTGKYELAKQNVEKGLSYSKFDSYLWFENGMLDFEKANYKEALVKFTKAYNLQSKNQDALFFKYLTMLKTGRDFEEIKDLWVTFSKNKNVKPYHFLYHADALLKLNYMETVFAVLNEGLTIFPNDIYLLNFYSYVMLEKYKTEKSGGVIDQKVLQYALSSIKKCIENSSEVQVEFLDTYFLVLEELNDFDIIKKELDGYSYIYPESQIIKKWMRKISKNDVTSDTIK